jgi:hypothetical protein
MLMNAPGFMFLGVKWANTQAINFVCDSLAATSSGSCVKMSGYKILSLEVLLTVDPIFRPL